MVLLETFHETALPCTRPPRAPRAAHGGAVPATIFLMSTVVIPRERHAGEKTARQVWGREKKEEPFLLVCDSSQSVDLLAFWSERSEDGLGL